MRIYTDKQRIIIYIVITFGLTYAYALLLMPRMIAVITDPNLAVLPVALVMFFPAIGSILTRIITKEGLKNLYLKPNLKVKGNLKYYLIAYLLPGLLILFGSFVYYLIFPNHGTLVGFDLTAVLGLLVSMLIAPILNIVTCLGEELGWRGYLVPKMNENTPFVKNMLITGVIWGLWHAPLTVMGHNYGLGYWGYPVTGILAMCVFCIINGIILSYVSLKTKSCIPAAIAHGSLNGLASAGYMFAVNYSSLNPFIGPLPTGIIGGCGLIIFAVIILIEVKNVKI